MKKSLNLILAIAMMIALAIPAHAAEPAPSYWVPHTETGLELPIEGATGYALVDLNTYPEAAAKKAISTISAGTAFRILAESGSRWQVEAGGSKVWVSYTYCMVNLPDVLPSIVYKATNSYDSMYMSSGAQLSGVTHRALYAGRTWNARLGQEEFMVPVLYAAAKKIAAAQAAALADGNTLVIYEGYRPMAVQEAVRNALNDLYGSNKTVRAGINVWGKSWFIAQSVSNHQRGAAIDVSLAKVDGTTGIDMGGGQRAFRVSEYTEYWMPTAMHELSAAAAALQSPVSNKAGAWKRVGLASTMTTGSKLLHSYCTAAGMAPLASEWWHFEDHDALAATSKAGKGGFKIEVCMSTPLP